MKPSYEELEEQLNRSRRLCDAALANERVWETAMMQACGEDGPKSVADKFAELKSQCAALAAENAGLKAACERVSMWNEFPQATLRSTGEVVPYVVAYGSNGERDYMRNIATTALKETPATDAFLAEVRAQGVKSLSNAVQSVISERQRQQSVEGWTPEHDDEHTEGEMAEAAACYAMFANNQGFSVPGLWPWAREWWKQSGQRRDLVKAGALILAEIERIDRQESAQ